MIDEIFLGVYKFATIFVSGGGAYWISSKVDIYPFADILPQTQFAMAIGIVIALSAFIKMEQDND